MAFRSLATRKALTTGLKSSRLTQSRALQTFSLPDLPYDFGALEPAINGKIMELHHQKHHQTYITNYNKALEQFHEAIEKGDSSTVVKLQSHQIQRRRKEEVSLQKVLWVGLLIPTLVQLNH